MTRIRIYHRLFITLTATMSAVTTLANNAIETRFRYQNPLLHMETRLFRSRI